MPPEYLIPLGIDGQKTVQGLNDIIGGVEKVADISEAAGKTIEDAFGKGAKAADNMEAQLKPTSRTLEEIRAAARSTGSELGNAFDISKDGKKFAEQINGFKKQLATVTQKQKIGIEVDAKAIKDLQDASNYLKKNYDEISNTLSGSVALLDTKIDSAKSGISDMELYVKELSAALDAIAPGTAKLDMEQELAATNAALQEERVALEQYQNELKAADDAQKNLNKTLEEANKSVALLTDKEIGLNSSFEEVYGTVQPLTTRLGELEDRMYELALAGQQNSAEFRELQDEAIRYRQTIQQVDAAVDTFAKRTAVLDIAVEAAQGLTGAFAAVQGATALFGDESEELQEALLKVNAAMSVLQGVQAVAAVLNKESAISALLFRNNTAAATIATQTQTVATQANTAATATATVATRALGFAFKALGIGLIVGLIAYLVENWDKLKDSLNKLLPVGKSVGDMLNTIKSVAMGVGNVVLQYLVTPFRAITALLSGNLDEFKRVVSQGFNFKNNFQTAYNKQEIANERAHQRQLEEERIKADARDLARRKNRGEDVSKQEIALQRRRLALQETDTKEYTENLEKLQDLQDQNYKTQKDAQQKAADDAKKAREDAAKKRLEDEKKNEALVQQYSRAAIDARIAAIQDEGERERASINEEYRRKIEDLGKESTGTAAARAKQAELEALMVQERNNKIKDLDERLIKERTEIQIAAQRIMADLSKEGAERDLELLRIDHEERKAEIETNYKDEADLRAQLLGSLEASTARERKRIQDEAAAKARSDEEERQLLAIELSSQYARKSEETERQKQIAILETKIEYAEKGITALLSSGEGENSLQVLQARKALKDLRDGLQAEIKSGSGKGFSFMEFIGLGDLDDDQAKSVEQAGKQAAQALGQITDFIVDQYDRQIEKKQEAIDQLDDEIGDLESRLEDEKELRDNGFANNVAVIEASLAEKQREKDEEVRQQEELMKKKQAMQKAQMAVDTAVQLVNLTTASTEIFKSLAGIPFIGIPLAIATIGTMFGAFIVAKVRAAQSISKQEFGEGGWIDGKSHAQGGKKYYSPDGDVRELEKDEFVVRRKQAKKFANVLEAINMGSFAWLKQNDSGLTEMLSAMGISLSTDSAEGALKESNDLRNIKYSISVTHKSDTREMREMNENIKYLAQREREKTESWEDEKYVYIKRGSKITRVLKNKENEPAD